jgi:hypothetical protein
MTFEPLESAVQWRRLQEILLGHLQAAGVPVWPGTDGLMLAEVLRTYLPAAAARRVPGREQLQAEHPHLDQVLAAFFRGSRDPGGGSGDREQP